MLEAKSQLSRLVKAAQAAQASEEVIIAHHGVPAVRLVAIHEARHPTRGWGSLKLDPHTLDAAFSPELDVEIAAEMRAGN